MGKGEEEGTGSRRRESRLLRGWVHCLPYSEGIRTENEFVWRGPDPRERAVEEYGLLQEEIERAQRAVRERIGIEAAGPSWLQEENARPASENERLWHALTRLATAVDLLRERLESLEVRRRTRNGR
ncbi:MAG: hypothetical protein PHO89_10660 [Methylacidiphilaceae bacterium]|nr:hypothetical protein [Candidatus Methylacidiphilaceae bacterium]